MDNGNGSTHHLLTSLDSASVAAISQANFPLECRQSAQQALGSALAMCGGIIGITQLSLNECVVGMVDVENIHGLSHVLVRELRQLQSALASL